MKEHDPSTGCSATAHFRFGGGDGLPRMGSTTEASVRGVMDTYREHFQWVGAVEVRMVPRNGQVWAGPGDGAYRVHHVRDFQIEAVLAQDAACPTEPQFVGGVPVIFTRVSPEIGAVQPFSSMEGLRWRRTFLGRRGTL